MRLALPLVLAALLLPASGAASTFSFIVSGGELFVDFGLNRFQVFDEVESLDFDLSGFASLTSGPLINHDVDEVNGFTDYSYGAGSITLFLEGSDNDGNSVEGFFTAETLPFSLTVCEGCDALFGGGTAFDFSVFLGDGRLDASLAEALGVRRKTDGGFMDFGLEDIDGGPFDTFRSGFDHRGFANLEIDALDVPEPGLAWLAIASGAALTTRRRWRRR